VTRIALATSIAAALAVALVAGRATARRAVFVRACATQPAGVSVPAGYRLSSVRAEPLSLYSFGRLRANGRRSDLPAARFRSVGAGRYRVYKLWALLPPGRGATVSVPPSERRVLSLVYDPALWNRAGWDGTARVAQGDTSVVFRACPRSRAQGRPPLVAYDGGLVVAGPRCARLEVRAGGLAGARTIVLALGRRRC
jgi:hypothetical protein